MADTISTIILRVDLDCHQCYKKIRKILCKLQDQERISTISYDDKSNAITIVGPFDPHKISCKIRRKGGKVIKDIQIMGEDKPVEMTVPLPVNNGKQKPKPKPKEKPPAADERLPPAPEEKPPAPAQAPPPNIKIAATIPAIMEEKKPKERPAELEPAKESAPIDFLPLAPAEKEKPRERPPPPAAKPIQPADVTPTVEIPSWPAPPVEIPSLPGLPVGRPVGPCGCPCCTACYQGYYEGCRCCTCGKVYGYAAALQAAGCYGGAVTAYCSGYRDCQLFSDENPVAACIVM